MNDQQVKVTCVCCGIEQLCWFIELTGDYVCHSCFCYEAELGPSEDLQEIVEE